MKKRTHLKHTMSCLEDQFIDVEIDEEALQIRLSMVAFDSALVSRLVIDLLPADGIVAYRDDSKPTEARTTRRSHYSLVIVVAGLEFIAQVVKLIAPTAGATVVLERPTFIDTLSPSDELPSHFTLPR